METPYDQEEDEISRQQRQLQQQQLQQLQHTVRILKSEAAHPSAQVYQ